MRGLISLDTGIAHYAWLTGTPLFQLFAGTGDSHRWGSLGASHLFHQPPPCAPCGSEVCHRPTHECMIEIRPEAVEQIIRDRLHLN
jgi:ADP-heptose:LPS heptosyltransferase